MRLINLVFVVFLAAVIGGCGYSACLTPGACYAGANEHRLSVSAAQPTSLVHQTLRDQLFQQNRLDNTSGHALRITSESWTREVVARDIQGEPLQFEWVAVVAAEISSAGNVVNDTFEARRRYLADANNLIAEQARAAAVKQQTAEVLAVQLQRFAAKHSAPQ